MTFKKHYKTTAAQVREGFEPQQLYRRNYNLTFSDSGFDSLFSLSRAVTT